MEKEIDYKELIQIHSNLTLYAVNLLNVLKSNVDILPEGTALLMPKLKGAVTRLSDIEYTKWVNESTDEYNLEYVPELIYRDHKRFAPYEEIFEEWCDAFEIKFWGTDKATLVQTLSYVVGDCAEFFADLSSMYPYKKDDED